MEKYIPVKNAYARDKSAVKESTPAKTSRKEETKRDQKSQGSALGRVIVHKNWFYPTSEQVHSVFNVVFPKRSGNSIVFYKSSKKVFEALDTAIRTAKKSVDIISMGLDTDLRLKRNGEYRGVAWYSKVFPAEVDKQVAAELAIYENDPYFGNIADPDVNSSVLSDLLTRRAVVEKAVVVRMIIGAPRNLVGNTFHDPLHLWWRCKTLPEYQGRIRFALREAKGVFVDPWPPPPIKNTRHFTDDEALHVENTRFLDFSARLLSRLCPPLYQFIFTHHQKLVLIDIEEQDATGFVFGSNLTEDYWDDSLHLAHNMDRYPYRAWHDSGLAVKGPVLYDIAVTFKQAWFLLGAQEFLPSSLYNFARAAYKNGVQLGHTSSRRFAFPLLPSIKKETPSWGVNLPAGPEFYKPHAGADEKLLETQFARTFSQEGAPKDFSIRKLIHRAIKLVSPGGVIYIENQYFRDLELMGRFSELAEMYSYLPKEERPKLIIITNDPYLNETEAAAAAGPTFMAYQMLEQCGLPFVLCCLKTKDWPEYTYGGARYGIGSTSEEIVKEKTEIFNKHLKYGHSQTTYPPAYNRKPKLRDPRKDIYIHSKVILFDLVFGMLGSANHNERSMWHDSEDALAFRNSERYNVVEDIQKELLSVVLSDDLPKSLDGKAIYEHFLEHLNYNDTHSSPKSLVHTLKPVAATGAPLIS
jgi:phosphatidylserine/phosphatidylglycerophosphate/cardiolipin synthase-like enzyme